MGYHGKVSLRTHEQLRDKKTLCCALTSWFMVSHMAGGALPTASMQAICARRQLLCVSRCAQRDAMSVHFFVIAGNFRYVSVLVDYGNAFFAV